MIHLTGHTDSNSKLYIDGKFMMDNYLKEFPNRRVIIKIQIMPELASDQAVYYYQQAVLPQMQDAFRKLGQYLTMQQIDQRLRSQFVGTLQEEIIGNKFITQILPVEQLEKETLMHFFDFVRIFAAENLKVQIADYRAL